MRCSEPLIQHHVICTRKSHSFQEAAHGVLLSPGRKRRSSAGATMEHASMNIHSELGISDGL